MSAYTDDQACIEASVHGQPWQHRKTIEAWAAKDPAVARDQRKHVRAEIRAEVGPDLLIEVRIVPGYCPACQK